jgi:hypothetical protein
MKHVIAVTGVFLALLVPAFAGGERLPLQLAEEQRFSFGAFSISAQESTGFGSQLSEGIHEVDFAYEWSGATPGQHRVVVRWLKDGAVISESPNTLATPAGKTSVQIKMSNGAPLPNGNYTWQPIDNDKLFMEDAFTIGKPRSKAEQDVKDAVSSASLRGAPAGSVIRTRGVKAPEAANAGPDFAEGVHEVDYWYEWSGAQPGYRVEVRLLKDDNVVSQSTDTLSTASGQNNVQFKFSTGAPLPSGNYQIAMIEDGKPWPLLAFTIGKPRADHAAEDVPPAGAAYDGGVAAFQAGNFEDAIRILEPDAQAGNVKSQVLLGLIYGNAERVKDGGRAVGWLRPAAERGDPQAQQALGSLYIDGTAVPKDLVQGYMWETLAMPKLDGQQRDLAKQFRDAAAQVMSPEQRQRGESMAKDWKPKTQ